jgi:hypothetical protein
LLLAPCSRSSRRAVWLPIYSVSDELKPLHVKVAVPDCLVEAYR